MKRVVPSRFLFGWAIVCCALIAVAATARAELTVKQVAKVSKIVVGAALPENHEFDLPEGAEILLERTPSGTQFEIHGPYKGTLETYLKNCNGWLAFTYPYCKGDAELPVGGTRGNNK